MSKKTMTFADAAEHVLRVHGEGEPMHYREITRIALETGILITQGKTPSSSMMSNIYYDMQRKERNQESQRFVKHGKGMYSLATKTTVSDPTESNESERMTFIEAAEHVLREIGQGQPMHYRKITQIALDMGILQTTGKTPWSSTYTNIYYEIQRNKRDGVAQKFIQHGKGMFSLAEHLPVGVAARIAEHNRKVSDELLEKLGKMNAYKFEELVAQLLLQIGFEDAKTTQSSADHGVDVRATLVTSDVIRIKMAVQVKRWKGNVGRGVVQKLRGSLGTHEQGLIVTTSNFTSTSREEAERSDAAPVGLINGQELVQLLIENGIGAHSIDHAMFQLDEHFEVE